VNKILLKAAANFKSTLSNKPKGFYRDEDDEQSSHSSDSAYINKDQVNKLNKELITTQMKLHKARTKKMGIKYGELRK
jgi:hypothetical protein